MTATPDGCLVVNKPTGLTSHDVVDEIRRAYRLKAGHGGTLDPLAQGVLLIFVGKALKILQFIPPDHLDKTYLMRVTLGRTTDTYDSTGQTVAEHTGPVTVTRDEILGSLRKFVGTYEQQPPVYSAIKVKGKRAYALARAGETVELASRKIHVTSIRLVRDYQSPPATADAPPVRHLVLRIHCSRGTYVRSIAHDLGGFLGCGGHLSYLLRERVGSWSLQDSFPVWRVRQQQSFTDARSFVPIHQILPFSRLFVSERAGKKVLSGVPLEPADIERLEPAPGGTGEETILQVISPAGELLALYGRGGSPEGKGPQKLVPLRVLG
ncbi:MAG: tRNA pseudouridine(55) synthase TruB [Candidatus Riflebacteria bacterium]|nr:tRNA pseudouridine(55) synthase TruB [Candidatus Riflebacteria bacterium]